MDVPSSAKAAITHCGKAGTFVLSPLDSGRGARRSLEKMAQTELQTDLIDWPQEEVFLLPDGHRFLEPVDALERRLERGAPVRLGDDHRHAGLADQQAPQAMHHGDPLDSIPGGD